MKRVRRAIDSEDQTFEERKALEAAKKRKRTEDLQFERLMRTEEALKRWNQRLKRAQTKVKKLTRRLSYYERVIDSHQTDTTGGTE